MALGADPVSYAVAFSAGFVSFASPCVLPLVPAYLSLVSGVGLGDAQPRRRDVAMPTAAFVVGFGAAFTALGVGAALFGGLLLDHRRSLEVAGGVFVILMGLLLLGRGVPMALMRERRFHLARRPATLAGSALAGVAFAVGWTPCIGPTLAATLTLAAQEGNAGVGASLLAAYSLGLGVPFLLAGLFMHGAATALGFLRRRLRLITGVGAALLIVFGVLLATGEMARVSGALNLVSLPL